MDENWAAILDLERVVPAVEGGRVIEKTGPTSRLNAGARVSRVSFGGAFTFAALGAVVEAARELQERGTYTFWQHARPGSRSAKAAFTNAASFNP